MSDDTAIGTTAKTGEEAPATGIWEIEGIPDSTQPVEAGQVLPPHLGEYVTWRLKEIP